MELEYDTKVLFFFFNKLLGVSQKKRLKFVNNTSHGEYDSKCYQSIEAIHYFHSVTF